MTVRADKHQRQLQELLTRPGNDACADCKSRAPRWSSWNIGIFVCVHCASIHRKMGTHISKVKSVSLDTWTKDQVESVRAMGNTKSNEIYNPDERRNRPPMNTDESDRDSEMEKYIRDKYQYKRFLAPPAAPPTPSVPRPPAKDPVPGRVGGTSLGEASDFDKVIRAPSRAKSTPIVSTNSSTRTNVLAPPSPSIPSSSPALNPVFEGGLPYRPRTASVLDTRSSLSHSPGLNNIAPSPSPQPYAYQPQQPPLQYLRQSMITTTPSSNPVWDDMLSLSATPSTAAISNSPSIYYGGAATLGVPSTAPSSYAYGGNASRSFSLPTTLLSPAVTGASAYSTGSNNSSVGSGVPNPFTGLSSGSTGLGSTNPFSANMLATQQKQQQQIQPQMTNYSGPSAWTGSYMQSSSPDIQQPFANMALSDASSFGGTTSPFQQQLGQQQPLRSQSALSFGQTYNTHQYNGAASPSGLASSISPFIPQQQQQQQQPQASAASTSQSSFAQSMLPAHLKPQNSGVNAVGGTNPFGAAWGQQKQQQKQQQYGNGGAWGGM